MEFTKAFLITAFLLTVFVMLRGVELLGVLGVKHGYIQTDLTHST